MEVLELYPGPNGAKGCSHGWSPRFRGRNPWKWKRRLRPAPAGAEESAAPAGAGDSEE